MGAAKKITRSPPIRTPVRKPVRTPVRRFISSPILSPSEASQGFTADSEDDTELAGRVQAKVQALPCPSQVCEPKKLEGLGSLFSGDSPSENVNEDTLEDLANFSVSAQGGDPQWAAMTCKMIHSSCVFMAQELLTGPPEPPYYGKFLVGDHHVKWDELVVKHRRLCILAPRDHGKTFFFDFAYPLWQAIRKPGGCGFIFSSTQDQAGRILDDIRTELETNPKLEWLVPKKKDKWGSRFLKLANGHRIYARGFGTRVRGAHPDWIVVDDGLNDETAYSETVRKKQKDYFYTAITNMIVPGGQIIVIGTPFHAGDLYADLKENRRYHFEAFPAESNPGHPDNKALWPERYSLKALQERRQETGEIRYAREQLVQPVTDDMSLFPLYLFQGATVERYNITLGMPKAYWDEVGVVSYMGVDFAMSSNVQADYTVVWVVGVDKFGNRWLMDMQREHGLPYQQQLSLINQLGQKYEPALIFLEANQMQRIFGDELIRTSDLPIKKFVTGIQKNTLDKGVPSLRVLLENGKFRIPRGDAESVEKTDIWINEMRSVTFIDGKIQSVGSHDDTVMALWITDQAIRTGGFQFSFGDEGDYQNIGQEERDALERDLLGEPESADKNTVTQAQTVDLSY